MELTDVHILLLINFFHFWNIGLIVPVISAHIIEIGGDHVVLGFVFGGVYICQQLSRDFLALFEHSSKFSLTFSLFVSFLCHLMAATTDSYKLLLLIRYMTGLVNSIEPCSKELIIQIEPEENHAKCLNLVDIMKTAGLVAGAIAGGYIYYYSDDFEFNALLAAISTLISLFLLQKMTHEGLRTNRQSNIIYLPEVCYNRLMTFKEIDYKTHWHIILLHITYITSFIIFFNKFSLLIQYNYQVGIIVTGYTTAYHTMLLFASNQLIRHLKILYNFSPLALIDHCLLISSVTLLGLYYAPTYECYLLIFIPMIVTHALVMNCLEDDMKKLKATESLFQATQTMTVMLNITAPIAFGLFYHSIGGKVFKVMSILPPAVCVYVVNKRFLSHGKSAQEETTQEDSKED